MKVRIYAITIAVLVTFAPFGAGYAQDAVLRFSDITSGPSIGLGDGLGSGAIVTIWGQHLGNAQGQSTITFTDSNNAARRPAYIYYWKIADGQLPGGPADLYTSHKMQEIAFSIPDAPSGDSSIHVTVDGIDSNVLRFTVTSTGKIYWVAPSGKNSNSGSFSSPMEYINADIGGSSKGAGDGKLSPGDIVYSRGVAEPELSSGGRDVGMYVRATVGTPANPISFVAYPNTRPTIVAKDQGMVPYRSKYLNLSKFYITVGHVSPALPPDPGASNQSDYHIKTAKGRYVGNYLGQNSGTSITGWSGAITSGGDSGEGVKVFGNEIDSLGSSNTSRFQHTTYMSIRSESSSLSEAWEFSFNYLHDNFPMFGIHFYDEQISSGNCGQLAGTLKVTNNVIVNQRGPAINIKSKDSAGVKNVCWSADILIEDNIIIRSGLGDEPLDDGVTPQPQAVRVGGDIGPSNIIIRNNILYEWGSPTSLRTNGGGQAISIGHHNSVNPEIIVQNNVFKSNIDYPFVATNRVISKSDTNAFYTSAQNPVSATIPNWSNSVLADPRLSINDNFVSLDKESPLVDAGTASTGGGAVDIYGNTRRDVDIGAVEYSLRPSPPSLSVVE